MSAALSLASLDVVIIEVPEIEYNELIETNAQLEKELGETDQAYSAIEDEAYRLRDEVAALEALVEELTNALEGLEQLSDAGQVILSRVL